MPGHFWHNFYSSGQQGGTPKGMPGCFLANFCPEFLSINRAFGLLYHDSILVGLLLGDFGIQIRVNSSSFLFLFLFYNFLSIYVKLSHEWLKSLILGVEATNMNLVS